VPLFRDVTLTQLEAFVLVARLGSVKAAAETLGVTEPAVSGALAALRQQLGDQLVERNGSAMVLTAGGQAFVGIASQMVALAAEADAAIRRSQGGPERLRVVATSTVAESVATGLLAGFGNRAAAVDVSLGVATAKEIPAVVHERLADVALGYRPVGEQAAGLESMPLFQYRLVLVAAPGHRLACRGRIHPIALGGQTWLVDPDATDAASPVRQLLDRLRVPERNVRVFSSQAAAWVAAQEGLGIAPAVSHLVSQELDGGSLVQLPVEGTPVPLMWHATTLPAERRSAAASALVRYLATPDATLAMATRVNGVPPSRWRPPVYVTLWS